MGTPIPSEPPEYWVKIAGVKKCSDDSLWSEVNHLWALEFHSSGAGYWYFRADAPGVFIELTIHPSEFPATDIAWLEVGDTTYDRVIFNGTIYTGGNWAAWSGENMTNSNIKGTCGVAGQIGYYGIADWETSEP